MSVSHIYSILWITGMVCVILPHFSLGLLSDYKICGDSECESLMGRVQAIRDHHGKDCRFLSFKKGDNIFVYHKLTGKRDDLWAGSIDKQFGYFPKDAVKEEEVHATVEKVLETQDSDFLCMDEFGYLIDSSHLDSDDDDDYDEKTQNQESDTTPYPDDTTSPSTSEDVSTKPVQEANDTPTEEDESKNASDASSGTHEKTQEAPSEQGGSAPSAWLGSSVTGWLGLATEEEHEEAKKDKTGETEADASFTSSVTGWLGLGGEGKPDDAVKDKFDNGESADSLASTMTGWFGLGEDKKTDHSKEKDQEEEKENEKEEEEPAEKFRSRRMSLDLEGSQLHEEEQEEMGTLDWLGNGLSNTLGFGLTNQESTHEETAENPREETIQEEKEEQAGSGSWFDVGIGGMLGFRRDNSEGDVSSENVDQSQPALTEEEKTESTTEEIPKDQNIPSEMETTPDINCNDKGTSDSSNDSVLPEDTVSEVDQEGISPKLEEKSQAVDQMSSLLDNFFQANSKEEDAVSDDKEQDKTILDGDTSAEINDKDQQTPKSVENIGEGDNREPEIEQSHTDQDFLTQFDINSEPDVVISDSTVGEEDKTDDKVDERYEIAEETSDASDQISVSRDAETDVGEMSATQTDGPVDQSKTESGAEEISEESLSLTASGTAEEGNDPVSIEDNTSTETKLDHSDSIDAPPPEEEVHPEGTSPEVGSSESTERSAEVMSETVSEQNTQLENKADQDSDSLPMQQLETHGNNVQLVETETNGFEENILRESGVKPEQSSEPETGEVEEENQEELKEEEDLEGLVKQRDEGEEKQDEIEEEQQEGREIGEEERQEVMQNEVEEVTEKEKLGEEEELKGEEIKEDGVKDEAEELKDEEKPQEAGEIREEENQERAKELMKEEKQNEVEGVEEEEINDEIEQIKQEGEQEEKEEEMQKQAEGLKEEMQDEVEELKEEERKEELEEVEEVKGQEKTENEEKQNSEVERIESTDEPESENSDKDTQDENNLELSETSTQTAKVEEENREQENNKQEEAEKVEGDMVEREAESRGKEEEGVPQCSNGLCPQASEDALLKERDGDNNSVSKGHIETGEQNLKAENDQISAERTGGSQTVPSEGTEENEGRIQWEEGGNDDAEADEGQEEQGQRNSEDVNNDTADSIFDHNLSEVPEIDKDLLYSAVPSDIVPGQTVENKDDQQYSSDVRSTNLSDDNHQGDKPKSEDTEPLNTEEKMKEIHLDHNVKHDDPVMQTDFRAEGDIEGSMTSTDSVEEAAPHGSQHPSSSSLLSDSHKTESGGAFGLFKNAFSFFGQKPSTESTKSAPSLDSAESSVVEPSLTPEQEMDSESTQVEVQDLLTGPPITLSQQPSPTPVTQTSSPSLTQTDSYLSDPTTGSPLQTKTLTKLYKNLLLHMSADETSLLVELFGRHKLQFLDYILGSSETTTDNPESDESIVLDIERLLHHHRETLVAPSMKIADAPQEDKEKTKTLIALQKLEMLLAKLRETFNTGKKDVSNRDHQDTAEAIKDEETATKEDSRRTGESFVGLDDNISWSEWMGGDKEGDGQQDGGTGKERVTEDEKKGDKDKKDDEKQESSPHTHSGPPQTQEGPGLTEQILAMVYQIAEDSITHVNAMRELLIWLTVQVVSSLPDDIRPGPDLYGVPWEPVIITSFLGLMTVLLFTCRCYSSVKSRLYRSKERWMAEQVAQLLDEKCKVLETLSKCQQEYDELENSLRDSGVLAQTQKTEHLEAQARKLGQGKRELERDLKQLKDKLDHQREHRIEQERRIAALEDSMKALEEETKDLQSQDEQAQTTLKVYSMNSDRLQRNLETAGEENTLLQESNAQLRQQVEGWAERVSELEAEMSRCEAAHSGMLQDVANKDERIMSLTDRLLRMKAWDSDLEEEGGEEGGQKEASNGTAGRGEENGKGDKEDTQGHLQKVQKLIYAAKLNADLKSVDEDKDRAFAKLNDEVKAKEDLLESIKELENEKKSLHSDTEHYSEQVQRLQQKLNIMTEMYQENELKLHRLLTVEEKERLQKEEKLNKADKNIAMAMEELNNYRQRAEDMEEELEKTKQSYQTQISAHEKKAHNNWLAARAADRELSDTRRENALLRQKLTDTQFKLDTLDKDPYALDNLARPLPFRAERSPYGPSPLGRPASETRAFLSPPTLMDGPPARLSPRVPRGPVEPPGGQGEMERSGGPHSDSGSISPTWERDRRGPPPGPPGPLGHPGYMFPEPGGPMYRRPPPPPGALGPLPPPGSLPPGTLHLRGLPPGPPHPTDMADGPYRENSLGPGDQEHREFGPGERRTPPEADPRMGGAPPLGPPMDGPFPRRAPYGPPPPDFFPPRGPGVPPMMPMWGPPPPGMMFPPPRFPPGGPPLPQAPHPHHAPPMRHPLPDGLPPPSMGPVPPQQSLPSPPSSQSPEEHTPSPEDAI